ncbi:MAG TPA: hypothetical protein VMK53_00435, partial [Gemmatimonadales bacterium]|nr:hypothetical protein [Gemmatimonadales bacterium]
LSNFGLAVMVVRLRYSGSVTASALWESQVHTKLVEADRAGFESVIKSLDLRGDVFLAGQDVVADTAVTILHPLDAVIYVLRADCPGSALNIRFLNSLYQQSSMPVLGVSFGSTADELREFVRRNDVAFPVVVAPTGRIASLLPKHLTPITAVTHDGRVNSFILGLLSDAVQGSLPRADFQVGTKPQAK